MFQTEVIDQYRPRQNQFELNASLCIFLNSSNGMRMQTQSAKRPEIWFGIPKWRYLLQYVYLITHIKTTITLNIEYLTDLYVYDM